MVRNTYNVINTFTSTVSTTSDQVTLANGVLTISGMAPVKFANILGYKKTAVAAGTAGVYTFTTVATAGATNAMSINQFIKELGRMSSISVSHVVSSTDTTATIANSLRAQLRALITAGQLNATLNADSNTTVVITAVAPDNFINIVSTGTVGSVATTTPAVKRTGYAADLTLDGFDVTSGATYAVYEFVIKENQTNSVAGQNSNQIFTHKVLANTSADATEYGYFDADLTTYLQAIATDTASIEQISIV